ncbi:MAG TPA: (2Fe-2S)-binding protein [Geobacteraceae bacterium]|nr:(2Fe-2S)-binding protein [Geobacteraceae bacterium]
MITFTVNGTRRTVEVPADTPLLWVIRDALGLTGTKYGCGEGVCGACTVLIDGKAVQSCQVKVSEAQGKKIVTIEGIPATHPVKQAWLADDVPQCGWCQPGQIVSAVALLNEKPRPSDADIDDAMAVNICRCGTYQRIRRAIHTAAETAGKGGMK